MTTSHPPKRPVFDVTAALPPDRWFDPRGGINLAVAAVVGDRARAASGYLASSGAYGVAGHPQPPGIVGDAAVTIAELRAVHRALAALRRSPFADATVNVFVPSRPALDYLLRWRLGDERYPKGYQLTGQRRSGKVSTLERLFGMLQQNPGRYLPRLAGGSVEDLAEGAAALAQLALRAGSPVGLATADEVRDAAVAVAATRIKSYWETSW